MLVASLSPPCSVALRVVWLVLIYRSSTYPRRLMEPPTPPHLTPVAQKQQSMKGQSSAAAAAGDAEHDQWLQKKRDLEMEKNQLLDSDDEADKVPIGPPGPMEEGSEGAAQGEMPCMLYRASFQSDLFWLTLLKRAPPDPDVDRWEQIAVAFTHELQLAKAAATKAYTESMGRVNDQVKLRPLLESLPMTREKVITRACSLHDKLKDSILKQRKAQSMAWKTAFLRLLFRGFPYQQALEVSMKSRLEAQLDSSELCYGELDPLYFYGLLKRLRLVQGHLQYPQELIFYDLGAGSGKLLFVAALAFNWGKVIGLEAVSGLRETFEAIKERWDKEVVPRLGNAKLVEKKQAVAIKYRVADVLTDEQWVKAGSVFLLHASGLSPETMQAIETKLEAIPRGCLVITVGRRIGASNQKSWALIGTDTNVSTSYGPATVYCLEKVGVPPAGIATGATAATSPSNAPPPQQQTEGAVVSARPE